MGGEASGLSAAHDIHFYDVESGHYISENVQRLGEIVADYDPTMRVVWIPPKDRDNTDTHPFAIQKREESNGAVHMVMKLTEEEMRNPQRVLERIFSGDTRKHDVLANLEAADAAQRAWTLKRQMEELEEGRDFAEAVIRSPLHTFKHNGKKYT